MDKENSMNLASLLDFTHFFLRGGGVGGERNFTHLSIYVWICINLFYNTPNILVFILTSNTLK